MRPAKLTPAKLRVIEVWKAKKQPVPCKTIRYWLGVSATTFWDAVYRRNAYRERANG